MTNINPYKSQFNTTKASEMEKLMGRTRTSSLACACENRPTWNVVCSENSIVRNARIVPCYINPKKSEPTPPVPPTAQIVPREVPLFSGKCDYKLVLDHTISNSVLRFTIDNPHITIPLVAVIEPTNEIPICINVDKSLFTFDLIVKVTIQVFTLAETLITDIITTRLTFINTLVGPEDDPPQSFGNGLAVRDNWLAVGSPFYGEKVGSGRQGNVWFFKLIDGVWNGMQTTFGDTFGSFGAPIYMSPSETWCAISATYQPSGGTIRVGRVYIYKRSGDTWIQNTFIQPPDLDIGIAGSNPISFGASVYIDDNWCVVGTRLSNSPQYVYIYRYDPVTDTYVFDTKLDDPTPSNNYFGQSVTLYNDTLVIGAYNTTGLSSNSGKVYIYKYIGSWPLVPTQVINNPNPGTPQKDEFGYTVKIYEDWLAVCAKDYNNRSPENGRVYMFKFNGTTWVLQQELDPPTPQDGAEYGVGMDLYESTLIVSANRIDKPPTENGIVYVYKNNSGIWGLTETIEPPQDQANQRFGIRVSLSGSHRFASAKGYNENVGQITEF